MQDGRLRWLPGVSLCIIALALGVGCPQDTPDELPLVEGEHLMRFVHLSDTQIVDQESPARLVRFSPFALSAWRPQEAYGVQTLDATLRIINDYADRKGDEDFPIDFLIATGDLTDGCQHNELRWFLDTMDGKNLSIDSGELDGADRVQNPLDNPTLTYEAEGISPMIPWYTVFGNHDGLASGVFSIDRDAEDPADWTAQLLRPISAIIGLHRQFPPRNEFNPITAFSPAIITAAKESANAETLELDLWQLRAGAIAADADRRFIDRHEFIHEHFQTASLPEGHGFTESNKATGLARYSVRPKADVPIRVIVLDTVPPSSRPGLPAHYGVMTREQMDDFLAPEIEIAEEANEFVIVATHHPSADFDLPYFGEKVGTQKFREFLATRPNVIAHICGHTHRNFVRRIEGANPYYEIETGSIIDYPQEARILDIYYDAETGMVRLKSQMISHMENPTRLSAESFRRSEIHASFYASVKLQGDAQLLQGQLEEGLFAGWPEQIPSKTERFGLESDRNFDVVIFRD